MDDQRRVTAADVARESGVSRTTVSFVLNRTPHQVISEATRQRVTAAADRLGYTPHGAARSLRAGRSDLVLFYLPLLPIGPSITRQMEHLGALLHKQGLSLVTYVSPDAGSSGLTDLLRSVTPAAVVGLTAVSPSDAEVLHRARIPVVLPQVEGARSGEGVLGTAQERIGRLQVEHLAVQGHRILAYALPDNVEVLHGFADARLEGVRRECLELGLAQPVVREVALTVESAATALQAWRALPEPPTAVCAYNDEVAIALLGGAAHLGLRVPEDMAVIGVDDVPLALVAVPPLTTVIIETRATSELLVSSVVRAIAGKPRVPESASDLVRLVLRDSA